MKKNLGILYLFIVLIVILFTAMLVLSGMYLNLRLNGVTSSLPEIPEKDKWILTNNSSDNRNSSGKLISPVFMGVKSDLSMNAAVYDKDARESLSKLIEPKMLALFNGYAERIELADDKAKHQFVSDTINSDSYIFMSFYNELPSSAILPGFYGSGSYMSLNESFDVKYIFIMPDGDSVKGVCFDDDLNVCILRPRDKIQFDQTVFYAYNEVSGFANFEFVSDTIPEPVFTESFEVRSLLIAPSFSFYTFDLKDNKTVQLLTALDFNPNLVKSYTYSDDNIISFVGEEKELYVSFSESMLNYNGYNGGIHMSEYLKYYPQSEGYTFTDTVLCVKYLINSLDRMLVGGDALPAVVNIFSDGNETVFKMKYFYNGIAVTDKPYDMTVVISGEYIKLIEIGVLFCDSGNLTVPVIPQKLALSVFDNELLNNDFIGCSAMFTKNDQTGNHEFTWVLRKDVE